MPKKISSKVKQTNTEIDESYIIAIPKNINDNNHYEDIFTELTNKFVKVSDEIVRLEKTRDFIEKQIACIDTKFSQFKSNNR